MKNLPMNLLRTFVAINDLGGFTQAGEVLGRSQPAVSLQLKRLEEQLNVQLYDRTHGLELTEEGQTLYNYARKILEINDAAVSRLSPTAMSGSVRLGIPNDFEVSFLPVLISNFSRGYPDVTLNVSSDLSVTLRKDFKQGDYDLIMTMDEAPSDEFAPSDSIIEQLVWVSSPNFQLNRTQPIPLVLSPKGCIYRQHITQALNDAGIAWRVLYCSSSLLGIQTAIAAGLGVSALAINTIPQGLAAKEDLDFLPNLGKVTIGLNYDKSNLNSAAARLLEYLRSGLKHSR